MFSFKSRILVAFIIAVSIISSFAFYMYSSYLSKRIYKKTEQNTLIILDLLNEAGRIASTKHNNNSFPNLIKKIQSNEHVKNAYFLDSEGIIKYNDKQNSSGDNTIFLKQIKKITNDVTIENFETNGNHYSRAFIKINNKHNCFSCHSSESKVLGYIVYEFSINQSKENLNFTRRFSIIFTVLMILILGGIVAFLHYRIVKKSLSNFQKTINVISKGDYSERVEIPYTKELGELGISFNKMIDKFQDTKNQLYMCHKKELEDKQKLATIGEMSARLAHEIRNPITGIANAIEIIVEETNNVHDKAILEEIKRQANRVNNAITNLLKYSKSPKLNIEKNNINNLIKSIIFFFESQALHKEIKFKSDLSEAIPDFYFDNEQIENCILNISLNSMQAIKKKGFIKYSTEILKKEQLVNITIIDDGIGIPEENLKDIFKPFFTTKTEGTGLGLAITKDIIEKHGGKIEINSIEKKSTTINIYLPLNQ
jgi:signal transduction histidine kinase